MKILSLILLFTLAGAYAHGATLPDNVRVTDEVTNYRLTARDGKPWQVKVEKTQTFEALRSDDDAIAMTFYDDNTSIDKASAPGSKPIYRQWIDDDIFYDDQRICALPLELKKGKPVKAEFKSTIKVPEQFSKIPLGCSEFTVKSATNVTIPAELAATITIEPRNLSGNMHFSKAVSPKGDVTYTVDARDIEPLRSEKYGTLLVAMPCLLVKGMFGSVGDLYSHLRSFLPDYTAVSPEVSELARKVTQGAPDTIAKIDSIAAWVRRNIRYVAIEHGDYAFSPAPPAQVLACRYGDCKGSASLVKGMMRAVGIDGRMVWIGTSGHSDLTWEEHTARSTGNHMIAAAIVGDSIIYVDGTVGHVPAGYIAAGIRGQQALIEDGEGYLLRTVPTPAADSRHSIEIKAAFDGHALYGKLSHTFSGDYLAFADNVYDSTPLDRRDKVLRHVASYGRSDMKTDKVTKDKDVITADFIDMSASQPVGTSLYVKLSPVWTMFCEPFDTDKRRTAAKFGYLENTDTDITLSLHDGMAVKSIPRPFTADNEWFEASIDYTIGDGEVKCHSRLRMKQQYVPVDKVKEWNDSLKSIIRASDSRMVLEKIE